MRATVQLNVDTAVLDEFQLLDLARAEIRETKPEQEWELYYPRTVADALQQVIRTAVAERLQRCEPVRLHEIGQRVIAVQM